MSKKYLVPINLAQNELQNARIQNLASDPGSPVKGQVYFNTTVNRFRVYDGATWQEMGTSTATGDMSKATYDTDNDGIVDNSEALNGQAGAHYLDRTNHTGTQAISTVSGLQTALDAKAASTHTHTSSQITNFNAAVDARVQLVVDAAPAALDTLNELAAALGDDPNFAGTVTTQLTSLDGRLDALEGASNKYTTTIGGATTMTVTHNLGTQDVIVQVREVSTNQVVEVDITNATTNTVTIGTATAPSANSLRVVVMG